MRQDIEFKVSKNKIVAAKYELPALELHITKIPAGARMPPCEVDNFELAHINRRFFQGESSIKLVERILGIDAGLNFQYKPGNY